jgi:hypothetical protein
MARTVGKLNPLQVSRLREKGMYGDGAGLYLQVSDAGAKSWIYRFKLNGKAREMGLGPLSIIGLAEARTKAAECRRLRHEGIDPIEARKDVRAKRRLDDAKAITFSACAEAYIKAHGPGWRNAKHAAQWTSTIETYAAPVFGALPVQEIGAMDEYDRNLRRASVWRSAGPGNRRPAGAQGAGADLANEGRDSQPIARPN